MQQCFLIFFTFLFGYTVGRIDSLIREIRRNDVFPPSRPTSKSKMNTKKNEISIDESKVVVDLSTSGFSSSENQVLGIITQSEDDIETAANKLAKLKKR